MNISTVLKGTWHYSKRVIATTCEGVLKLYTSSVLMVPEALTCVHIGQLTVLLGPMSITTAVVKGSISLVLSHVDLI